MPITLPTRDDASGRLQDVTYYDANEVAERLGFTPRTVRRHTTGPRGDWPHVRLVRSPYLSEEHLARVVELLTFDPDKIPEGGVARLGIACTTNDLEDIAEPVRDDNGAPQLEDDDDEAGAS